MPTLYVIEPDARIEKVHDRILVTREDEQLFRAPLRYVSDVVLVGYAGATTQAMHALLNAGIPLTLVSRTGSLIGKLLPDMGKNLPLRQAQYRRNDEQSFCLDISKQIVAGKITNQSVLARRWLRRRPALELSKELARLKENAVQAKRAQSIDSLMGIEGESARLYFSIYRQVLNPDWSFKKRTRRPPKDAVNALLSLGYTMLGHAVSAALEIVGLDPYLGYFHAEKYGRPTLVLDLVEEFRGPVVDSLVLDMVNHNLFDHSDFTRSTRGIELNDEGWRIFISKFSGKLEQKIRPRDLKIDRPTTYRKLFEMQARKLSHFILGESPSYQPFRAR